VGVERGVEKAEYAGEIEAAILGVGMVAVDGEGEEGERADQQKREGAALIGRGELL
jgi:hypothetical protein